MLRYAGYRSLWFDDLATIGISGPGQSIREIVYNFMTEAHFNPPLFYVFAALWIRIAPFGTFWLLLPSILFVTLGMFFCGLIAGKICGNRASIFTTIIASLSWWLILAAGYTFRSYGLLFFLSALCVYVYIIRLEKPQDIWKYVWIYGIASALLVYTHYFGILVIGFLFLCDVFILMRKKIISIRHIISYVVCGVLFLPFFIPAVLYILRDRGSWFWPQPPGLQNVYSLFNNFVSNSGLITVFYMLGLAFCIAISFWSYAKKYMNIVWNNSFVHIILVVKVFFVIGVVYLYSRFINPSGSVFVYRYFIVILPHILVVSGVGLAYAFELCLSDKSSQVKRIAMFILSFVMIMWLGRHALYEVNRHANTINQPYEQAANWIFEHEYSHNSDSIVLVRVHARGFSYYVTHGWQRPSLNLADVGLPIFLNRLNYKYNYTFTEENHWDWNTVYVFYGHHTAILPVHVSRILNTYFELVEEHREQGWRRSIYVYKRIQN